MNELASNDEGRNGFLLNPTNFEQAMQFCGMLAKSSVIPTSYAGKPGDIFAACTMGAEVGLSPMQALQGIAVINGRPCIWGDAMLAIVQHHPSYVSHEERNANDALAAGEGRCLFRRRDAALFGKVMEFEGVFSRQDAVTAGLWEKKGPWQQYPGRMLQMRARALAARDAFADALKGLSSREEAEDYHVISTDVPDVDVLMPRRIPKATASASGSGNVPKRADLEQQAASQSGSRPQYFVVGVETKEGAKGEYHRITLRNSAGTTETFNSFSSTVANAATELIGSMATVEFKKSGQYHNVVGIGSAAVPDGAPADEDAPW